MNGWANYQTWNVTLYIANEESLYFNAVEYVMNEGDNATYSGFIERMDLADTVTPDGVGWLDPTIDYDEADKFIKDLVS